MQKEGWNGLIGFGRGKPCERFEGKRQKILSGALPSQRERGKFEKSFEKVDEQVKYEFLKKLDSRCSIDRKIGSINQTRQRLTKIFQKDFDWSKIRLDQSKIWKKHLFRRITWFLKTYLKALNIRSKNAWVWDEMFFQNTSFKPSFPKI